MAVVRNDSQQTTASMYVVDADGTRRCVASATCHIRPGKGLTFSLDLLEEIGEADAPEVAARVADYMAEEIAKAAALGVPVALPGKG